MNSSTENKRERILHRFFRKKWAIECHDDSLTWQRFCEFKDSAYFVARVRLIWATRKLSKEIKKAFKKNPATKVPPRMTFHPDE